MGQLEVRDDDRKVGRYLMESEFLCLKWRLTCESGFLVWGSCVVWGRVLLTWEECSLYLLEVGMRECGGSGLTLETFTLEQF